MLCEQGQDLCGRARLDMGSLISLGFLYCGISFYRDGDVPDLTADPSLAQKELGFIATRGLDEACNDLWRWQQGNPNGSYYLSLFSFLARSPMKPCFLAVFFSSSPLISLELL